MNTEASMKEVSDALNIDRANVCRYVADFSRRKVVWVVTIAPCRITQAPVMHLTTNFEIAQQYPDARLK